MISQKKIFGLSTSTLHKALQEWKHLLGDAYVLEGDKAAAFNNCPSQVVKYIPAVLRPDNHDEVQEIMKIATRYHIPVYPISTGKNWGFGGAIPSLNATVIIDLSRMNRIIDFIPDLGIVTIEPGVTQEQLALYLQEWDYPYSLSATSSSPKCSVIGNALERGHGLMPHMDRFMSLTSLKAVLPDGKLYQSLLADGGGHEIDKVYKWGVGPYLDGLFSQGGFGIVTQASFALAPTSEKITMFLCTVKAPTSQNQHDFNHLITTLRQLKHDSAHMISTFEIGTRTGSDHHWSISGAIHANEDMTKLITKKMRQVLRNFSNDVIFWDKESIKRFEHKKPLLKREKVSETYVRENINLIRDMLKFYQGIPQENAMKYAYHHQPEVLEQDSSLDAMEGKIRETGMLWYWPLIPARGTDVQNFVELVNKLSQQHGFEPIWNISMETLTYVSAGVHIFYDPKERTEEAWAYYNDLFQEGKKLGFLPHRAHTESSELYSNDPDSSNYFSMLLKIKKGIDPLNLIAMRMRVPNHLYHQS